MNAFSVETPETAVAVQFPSDFPAGEDAFFKFCQANPELRIERNASRNVMIMQPAGTETGGRNAALTAQLYNWSKANGVGKSFDSSAGFRLPNGAIRNPDAAWVPLVQWKGLSAQARKRFAPICPDFLIELRSETDCLITLQAKMTEYMGNGAKLGFLIDPFEGKVHVYRPGQTQEILGRPPQLSAEPEMPGLIFDLTDVWS